MSSNAKDVLAAFVGKTGDVTMLFDVDETLKHPANEHAPHRFHPNLPFVLSSLHQLGLVGIATAQSQLELQKFISKLSAPVGKNVTTGPYDLEDGHVLVTGDLFGELSEVLTSPQALQEIEAIFQLVQANLILDPTSAWGLLPTVSTPVALPDSVTQGKGSRSVWEQGPSTDDPEYRGQYQAVMDWLTTEAESAGLLVYAALEEVGNGTLRIVEKGVTKATGMSRLQDQGILQLSRVIFTGNGYNDVPPARLVKDHGGLVVAVSNATEELKAIADIVTDQHMSNGVVEVFSSVI